MITAEQLAEWRKLAEAATPGPWEYKLADGDDFIVRQAKNATEISEYREVIGCISFAPEVDQKSDANFIAITREAVPALLDEIERLRTEFDEVNAYIEKLEAVAITAREPADEYVTHYDNNDLTGYSWPELHAALKALDEADK